MAIRPMALARTAACLDSVKGSRTCEEKSCWSGLPCALTAAPRQAALLNAWPGLRFGSSEQEQSLQAGSCLQRASQRWGKSPRWTCCGHAGSWSPLLPQLLLLSKTGPPGLPQHQEALGPAPPCCWALRALAQEEAPGQSFQPDMGRSQGAAARLGPGEESTRDGGRPRGSSGSCPLCGAEGGGCNSSPCFGAREALGQCWPGGAVGSTFP